AAFDEIYAARYGYAQPSEPVEVVTWKLSAIGGAPRIALPKTATTAVNGGLQGRPRAYFPGRGGGVDRPPYHRHPRPPRQQLAAGMRLTGPAIVEERESTSVLPPGAVAGVDEYANLIVEVGAR